jgi:hypothetical protein
MPGPAIPGSVPPPLDALAPEDRLAFRFRIVGGQRVTLKA